MTIDYINLVSVHLDACTLPTSAITKERAASSDEQVYNLFTSIPKQCSIYIFILSSSCVHGGYRVVTFYQLSMQNAVIRTS